MKLFLRKSLIYIFPLLLIIFSVNLISDPASLFGGFETQIAKNLSNGFNVTGIRNIDERVLQKKIIEHINFTPETVIIGSSRIMMIGRTYYGAKSFNNGVSGASIEDIIAIYQIYKEKGIPIKKLVIGIDPWLFNQNNGQSRWLSIKEYYYSYYRKKSNILTGNLPIHKYAQLFSLSYFQASIKSLPTNLKHNKPIVTADENNSSLTRLRDGTINYGLDFRKRSEGEINNAAEKFISGNIYSIENYNELSEKLKKEFELFVKKLSEEKVELEFLLMPYHPIVWKHIDNFRKYDNVKEVERYIYDFAQKNNIKIIGSYNPMSFELSSKDFYDGMHLTPIGIKKVLLPAARCVPNGILPTG